MHSYRLLIFSSPSKFVLSVFLRERWPGRPPGGALGIEMGSLGYCSPLWIVLHVTVWAWLQQKFTNELRHQQLFLSRMHRSFQILKLVQEKHFKYRHLLTMSPKGEKTTSFEMGILTHPQKECDPEDGSDDASTRAQERSGRSVVLA